MRLSKKKFKMNYVLLAFLAPMLGMCAVMMSCEFIPFGKTSMLYSDMYHQYYPFFVSYRDALRSGDSLLYSWNVGMGMDYLGLISYYLASPLNLFSVLVPEHLLLEYFSLLVPIKLGLAGMFFAIFLKKLFDRDDASIVVFGSLYALCAWALGYHWNVMWLDTFALLPLVALGTIKLLRERKFVLYTVALFLSVFINYYIGLFVCIFVALIFLCYQISRFTTIRRFFEDLGLMALFSAIAIGMTAILTLPAYASLQNTYSTVNTFPKGFDLNIADKDTWSGLFDAMKQVAGNMNVCIEPTFKEGLPNVYCGLGINMLAILFLTSGKAKWRDRICSLLMLIFFNLSFILRKLDYMWHGFHFTNMIPYRFSFLYSFVMLYMAYRAWLMRHSFKWWQVGIGILGTLGLCACAEPPWDPVYFLYNGFFVMLYGVVLMYNSFGTTAKPKKTSDPASLTTFKKELRARRKCCTIVLLGVMCIELTVSLLNFSTHFTGTTVDNYPRGTKYSESLINYMKEREEDNLFYRAEVTHSQTLNDGALNGYNGISTFTSSANVKVTEFMRAMGYAAKNNYNRYCFEEGSPVANLFLNLKYMLERQNRVELNYYFTDLHQYGKVHLLENNAYLPLGFLANQEILDVDFTTNRNSFLLQNDLFRSATGLNEDVWTFFSEKDLTISATGVTISSQSPKTGYCSYVTPASTAGTLVYRYVAPKSGFVCVDLNISKVDNFSFWKDGKELYSEAYSLPQTLSVCHMEEGEVFEIHLTCNANTNDSIRITAGILDDEIFWKGYDILNASTLQLTTFQNTLVEGTINCNRSGVLYTSIPQDGNWIALVDGKPVEAKLVGDAMVALELTEGSHTITFRYENDAFSLGWKVTLLSTLSLIALYLWFYRPAFLLKIKNLCKKKNG